METNLVIIRAKEFREVVKSYGVKYRKEIPSKKIDVVNLESFYQTKIKKIKTFLQRRKFPASFKWVFNSVNNYSLIVYSFSEATATYS